MSNRLHLLCLLVATAAVFVTLLDLVRGGRPKPVTTGHVYALGR